MSHGKLYRDGVINLREFRELNLLKAQYSNPHFTKEARKMYRRTYQEKEKEFKERKKRR